ncbi:MAG TPA: MarR family transcriptional regulator [Gammaproteobacteria bacterium]
MMATTPAPSSGNWFHSERPERVVGFLLKSLTSSLRQSVEEALRERGIPMSFAQLAALFTLYFEPGITGAQLARRAMVSAQTMSAGLGRLEREGLIERRPHPESRRADSWHLTDDGRRRLEQACAVGDAVFTRMLSALEPDEVERLQDYLGRCVTALGAVPGCRT